MLVVLHKYLIVGKRDSLDLFLNLAQKSGFIEFIHPSRRKGLPLPEEAQTFLSAIKKAKKHEIDPRKREYLDLPPLKLAESIVQLEEERETMEEAKRVSKLELSRVSAFGHFEVEKVREIEEETHRVFQFFCRKSSLAEEMKLPEELIFVGREYDLDYFVAVNKEKREYPQMIEIHVEKSANQLRDEIEDLSYNIERCEEKLRMYAHHLPLLQEGLSDVLNQHGLQEANHAAQLSLNETLFALEAWVPSTKGKALRGLVSSLTVHCERIAIESHDRVPTYMENKGVARIGEDLVQIYDTPSPSDSDPSLWILICFAIFFAMIISDAGYGLIYLLLTLWVRWKFPRLEGLGKRLIRLGLICSCTSMAWGIATASYFGIEIGPNNPLRSTSFLHMLAVKKASYHIETEDDVYKDYLKDYPALKGVTDGHRFLLEASHEREGKVTFVALDEFYDNLLMEISFLVGILHISISFLRSLPKTRVGIGWILFMVGGYLYFPSILDATTLANIVGGISKQLATQIGFQFLLGGLGGAFLFALFERGLGAFHELLNAIQVFADVLSYVRLYALALAGMVMAHTFNDHLGLEMGVLGGCVVVFFGHLNNIVLATMGGVIHSLRLNFLEWYHYCFEGGGKPFNPLKMKKIQ